MNSLTKYLSEPIATYVLQYSYTDDLWKLPDMSKDFKVMYRHRHQHTPTTDPAIRIIARQLIARRYIGNVDHMKLDSGDGSRYMLSACEHVYTPMIRYLLDRFYRVSDPTPLLYNIRDPVHGFHDSCMLRKSTAKHVLLELNKPSSAEITEWANMLMTCAGGLFADPSESAEMIIRHFVNNSDITIDFEQIFVNSRHSLDWLSVVICGYLWLSVVICGYL